ncbi:MAG: hypothetical protein JM58_13895 [Peptococcaceae bacterium BICA1-8]|nr:MAG: hypothetical protein JM58_13895 [Peptococcaceae bacterium BICA1-8]
MFDMKNVHKYSERYGLKEEKAFLAQEEKVTLFLNNAKIISLLCSPANIDELALGFLIAEGFICTNNDYFEVDIREKGRTVYVYADQIKDVEKIKLRATLTSGCGQGTTFSEQERTGTLSGESPFLSIHKVLSDIKIFQNESLIEGRTGGVHSAGLAIDGELVIRKDVGRHNAVDKVWGYCLLNSKNPNSAALYLTGRISSEIIYKALKMQIPFIISLSGATSRAMELAQDFGITLLGYVRGKNAVIYSHSERIKS